MKLKMRLGQPVAKSSKDREINLQDQLKLEITVNNTSPTGEQIESTRIVRQTIPEEEINNVDSTVQDKLNEKLEITAFNVKISEQDTEASTELIDQDIQTSSKNTNKLLEDCARYELNSSLCEENMEAMEESVGTKALKRKTENHEVLTKHAKLNDNQIQLIHASMDTEDREQIEDSSKTTKIQNTRMHNSTECLKLNNLQLTGLSISLSQNGRNVEEVESKTTITSTRQQSDQSAQLQENQTNEVNIDEAPNMNTNNKNLPESRCKLKPIKIKKQGKEKNKSTNKIQDSRNKETLCKTEENLLQNR